MRRQPPPAACIRSTPFLSRFPLVPFARLLSQTAYLTMVYKFEEATRAINLRALAEQPHAIVVNPNNVSLASFCEALTSELREPGSLALSEAAACARRSLVVDVQCAAFTHPLSTRYSL